MVDLSKELEYDPELHDIRRALCDDTIVISKIHRNWAALKKAGAMEIGHPNKDWYVSKCHLLFCNCSLSLDGIFLR